MKVKQISIVIFLFPVFLYSQVYLTKDEALKLYFPNSLSIERKTVFLTDEQVEKIQQRAKAKVESKIITYYIGKNQKNIDGYAFLETHTVRTMPETFIAVIDTNGSVLAVEILAFYEPEDYLPPKRWLALLKGKTINSDLWLKRGVQNIVGATLSAQAITEGLRRILATFEVAIPKEK
jgi:hypothetical protein